MGPGIHFSKPVMIDQQRHDLPDKEDPFDGPSEYKIMDQAGSGTRIDQRNDKPDTDTADPSEHHGEQQEEPGVFLHIFKQCTVLCFHRLPLRHHEKESASHRQMRNNNMQNSYYSDDQSTSQLGKIPGRIVHDWEVLALNIRRII